MLGHQHRHIVDLVGEHPVEDNLVVPAERFNRQHNILQTCAPDQENGLGRNREPAGILHIAAAVVGMVVDMVAVLLPLGLAVEAPVCYILARMQAEFEVASIDFGHTVVAAAKGMDRRPVEDRVREYRKDYAPEVLKKKDMADFLRGMPGRVVQTLLKLFLEEKKAPTVDSEIGAKSRCNSIPWIIRRDRGCVSMYDEADVAEFEGGRRRGDGKKMNVIKEGS